MAGSNKKITVKDICVLSALAAILFIQEELLTFIPNVQLTVFLIVLYSKRLGFVKTTLIVFTHVILDNLFMGSFNIIFVSTMFVGWMFIPILYCTVCRRVENPIILGIVAVVCSFLYCWVYMIPNCLVYHMRFIPYLISDIPFEITLAICSFLTVSILYIPMCRLFDKFNI